MNFSRSALSHIKTKVCLKYFVNGCLHKQFFASNSPGTLSNFIWLTDFLTLRFLTMFNLKLEQLICKKILKFDLLNKYFPDLVTETQIWYWKSFKFSIRYLFRKIKQIPAKIWLFLTIKAVNKDIKSKRKFYRQPCS